MNDSSYVTTYAKDDYITKIQVTKINEDINIQLTSENQNDLKEKEYETSFSLDSLYKKGKYFTYCSSVEIAFVFMKLLLETESYDIFIGKDTLPSTLKLYFNSLASTREELNLEIPYVEPIDKYNILVKLYDDLKEKVDKNEEDSKDKITIIEKEIEDKDNKIKDLKLLVEELQEKIVPKSSNDFDNSEAVLHWISNTVKYIDSSNFVSFANIDMMLGKQYGLYYLSVGNKNHFITFDLGRNYLLKEIKLSVDNFECSLKNFKISVKDSNGTFRQVGSYIAQRYDRLIEFQYFSVNTEGRIFKFDLIDSWGLGGGNHILIKRLLFNVKTP